MLYSILLQVPFAKGGVRGWDDVLFGISIMRASFFFGLGRRIGSVS
jgi:hypothetical protein